MARHILTVTIAAALVAVCLSCGSKSSTPAAPTVPIITVTPPPNLTAPTVQSPVNGQMLKGLTATLTASAATVDISTLQLKYRFQVFNDASTLISDSGLLAGPTWTTLTLTPNKRFTWKVRAEADGWMGPWSALGSFTTPDPPPAFATPIGNWEACASLAKDLDLVGCVWNAVRPTNSVGDLEVVKRVAWLRRGDGAGLLIKTGGENVVLWQGYSLSASRICFRDGHIYKLIGDAGPGGTNVPGWADNGFVDISLYVPAIDPSKP